MEQVLEFLKGFNIQTIFSLAAIVWFFSSSLKAEMKLLESQIDRLGSRIDQQAARSDRLYEMFIDLLKDKKAN